MDMIVLGHGELNWRTDERQTDRYGAVHLNHDGDSVLFDTAPVGMPGQLVAVVLATRRSTHVGDWARAIGPTTPTVGEEITLGTGTLFVEPSRYGNTEIGVTPDDGRSNDWLDPAALYPLPRPDRPARTPNRTAKMITFIDRVLDEPRFGHLTMGCPILGLAARVQASRRIEMRP